MFMVMQTYRVRSQFREDFLAAIGVVAKSEMDLGCVFYQVFENDDRKNEFVELMGFDSWSHYERLRSIPPSSELAEILRKMDAWIEGGNEAIEVTHWTAVIE